MMGVLQTPQADTQAILDHLATLDGPKLHEASAPDSREMFRQMCAMLDLPAADISWRDINACGVPSRLYSPDGSHARGEIIIYLHGGGWVFGDRESHHSYCSSLASQSGLRLLSVDYRLAPEHVFPAAHDDVFDVIRWAATSPAELTGTVSALGVAGDSAGGNLAAAAAIAFRSDKTIPLKAQWLIYPVTNLAEQSDSYALHAEGYLLERITMEYFRDTYAPDVSLRRDYRLSPLHAVDVSNAAPAIILTCGLDPLRDEGRAYAAKLVQAGVPVAFHEACGQIHGVVTLRGGIASSQPVLAKAAGDFIALLTH